MEFFLVVFVFAHFLVDKRSDKDDVGKNIKPKHKNDHRSEGAVNGGIFYRRTYEPGEKSAYYGENKRTENRSGKNVYVIRASPCVAVINGVKHSCGNDIQNYETEPVPKVCKVKKIYKIDKSKERFKKGYKPSSTDNGDSENVDSNKKSDCVNKAEREANGICQLPTNLKEAVRAMKADTLLT